jgi:iron complex transport system substrate-binding protein
LARHLAQASSLLRQTEAESSRRRLVALGLALVLLPACQSPKRESQGLAEFTDELGRTVRVTPHPQRIVSLAPSVTEVLFSLGLEDRIVGVTSYCDYPPEARQRENVGDTQRPSIEKIVALDTQLVIASTASQLEPFVKKLADVGVPVFVSSPRDLDGVFRSIERMGEVTGTEDRARRLSATLQARAETIEQTIAGRPTPSVLLILGTEPLFTVGRTSFINNLIQRAGGRSISSDIESEYPQFSLETAVARQPEVIFLQAGENQLPGRLNQTPAARNGRVFRLNDDLLLRPGPRIVEGLEEMARKIHPDAQWLKGAQ